MNDPMMQDMGFHGFFMWGLLIVIVTLGVALTVFFLRRVSDTRLPIEGWASKDRGFQKWAGRASAPRDLTPHETVFVLPDISHYTRFMAGTHFSFGHAQHIVLSLLDAMIEAATQTLELSKLEGDAALFYVDAHRHSPEVIGETVMAVFGAFFRERKRLMEASLCRCQSCKHIADLDLKIFVHRGQAARFSLRGFVDHSGTDVIVLHRLMKNSVASDRYVMITDAASTSVKLPKSFGTSGLEENVADVGSVRATVHEIDDAMVAEFERQEAVRAVSYVSDTLQKLRMNIRSIAVR